MSCHDARLFPIWNPPYCLQVCYPHPHPFFVTADSKGLKSCGGGLLLGTFSGPGGFPDQVAGLRFVLVIHQYYTISVNSRI